jgi:hypothetical protein
MQYLMKSLILKTQYHKNLKKTKEDFDLESAIHQPWNNDKIDQTASCHKAQILL